MTIYHKKYGTNVDELELELLKFPNAKHDDMIDSLASAVNIASIEYKPEAEVIPTQDDPLWILKDEWEEEVEIDFQPFD